MKKRDTIRLSKLMSFALRHAPQKFNLAPDAEGWVTVEALLAGLQAEQGWQWLDRAAIEHVVRISDKQRFEITDDLIRARYGHSRAAKPIYQAVTPPKILYHGTPRRNLDAIRQHGLKAMGRQYVHLSATPQMATQVGKRRDEQPALLIIRAAEAEAAGVHFGTPSGEADNVYLVDAVPPEFIKFPE